MNEGKYFSSTLQKKKKKIRYLRCLLIQQTYESDLSFPREYLSEMPKGRIFVPHMESITRNILKTEDICVEFASP